MKSILIVALFFVNLFNFFGNEKIDGLKYKHKYPAMKFYLTDEKGARDYGYYEVNLIADDVIDNTVEPYKDLVKPDLIKRYAISNEWWRWCTPWACVGGTFGGIFFGVGVGWLCETYTKPWLYQQEGYPANYLQDNRNGAIGLTVSGGLLIAITCALIGIFAYNVANCIKIKKQILNILNGGSISMMDNDSIKVSFGIDIKYDPVGVF
jgi:hypothetical protein